MVPSSFIFSNPFCCWYSLMQKAAGHHTAAGQLTDIAKLLLVSQDYHFKEVLEPLTICDINASQFISFYLFFIQNCVINLFFSCHFDKNQSLCCHDNKQTTKMTIRQHIMSYTLVVELEFFVAVSLLCHGI